MLRRAFLSTVTAAGAWLAPALPAAAAQRSPAGPARHPQDDWLDQAPERHRVIFDTWMADLRLAVCSLTTRAYTQIIAKETGAESSAVLKELTANTAGPATFVPAGIVAVTRAQERGYALVSIG